METLAAQMDALLHSLSCSMELMSWEREFFVESSWEGDWDLIPMFFLTPQRGVSFKP